MGMSARSLTPRDEINKCVDVRVRSALRYKDVYDPTASPNGVVGGPERERN